MTEIAPARRRSPVGIASLVAGVLLLLWGLVGSALRMALPAIMESAATSYGVASMLIMIPGLLLALLALVLGVIGLLLRDRPRVAAIIGTTLGASHLLLAAGGALASLLAGALFY